MTTARRKYERRFARRSRRSRSQDLARQARITVSASDRSKRARRLLARWERTPNQLDVRGVDVGRRTRTRTRPSRHRTATRARVRMPAAAVTPPPAPPLARPAPKRRAIRPRVDVRFTPAPGVPKDTTKLIREFMSVVSAGKPIPKALRKRAREDPYLAERGITLSPPAKLRPHPPKHHPDAPPATPPSPDDIVVRADGEVIEDWLSLSAAERRKLMRSSSPPASAPKESAKAMRPKRRKTTKSPIRQETKKGGTAARQAKAEAWREFRRFRPTLTPDAYRKAREAMRAVMVRYTDESPTTVTEEQKRGAVMKLRAHFVEEMKRRHEDFGPEWGHRKGRSRHGRMVL